MSGVLKLLVIEDVEADFLLLGRHLEQQGLAARCRQVASLAELAAALDEGGWDAVLSDYNVPGLEFREGLALIQGRFPDLPVILVSGSVGEEQAVELLKLGVWDFVLKDRPTRLAPALERSLADAAQRRARRSAEQALRTSEEKYRRLVEGLKEEYFFYQHGTDGVFTYVSPSISNVLGYAPGELRVHFADLLSDAPMNRDATRHTEEALRGVAQPPYDVEVHHKDGSVRVLEVLEAPILDGDGRVIAVEGIAHDVTRRKAAEAATRAALERFEAIIEHTPNVAIQGFDRAGTVLHWNPASEALYGVNAAEALGRRLQDLLHDPETAREFEATVDGIWRSGRPTEPSEWPVKTPDGRELWVYSVMFPVFESGTVAEVFCMDVDVTGRKQAEAALRDRESRIRLLLDSTAEAIYGIGLDGNGTFVNPACVRMLGYEREEELIGRNVHALIHHTRADGTPSPAAGCRIYEALREARAIHVDEEVLWRKDGTSFPAEYWSYPMHRGGELVGTVVTFVDITERRRAEEALRASEARHRAIAETAADAIVSADQAGNIVAWNTAARRMFGYSEEEALGRPLTVLMPERFREAHQQGLARYRETGKPRILGKTLELEARHQDGTEFPVEISLASWTSEGNTFFGAIIRDISQRKRYQRELERHANYDTLTGLANRNLLQDRIRQAAVRAGRSGRSVAVLLVNLDGLRLINDSLGHGVGDAVLRTVAVRLAAHVREEDTLARLGGDEFVVVLPDVAEGHAASSLARTLLDAVAEPIGTGKQEVSITCSIGIGIFPKDGADPDTLLRNADAAMRRAREQGRGRLQFFAQEMNARASERLRIRTGLARALERGELRLHYQPVVDLRSGRVHQVEALLRWQSPDGMFLVPAEFIAIAEETGLVSAIGEWVLEQACRQARLWRERHDPELQVAVNVSSVQVRDGTLLEAVRRALRGSVLPPEALEIGVSASHFLSAADGDSRSLKALKGLGVTFAIDDFGTQYAGLGFMRHLQVDRLKVGQSFIREITTDAGYAAIVRAIISMAHGLGMKVSAGGVTTAAQLNYLRKLNCDEAQGHYFGPAVPAQEMEQQLAGPVRRFGTEPSDRTLLLVDDEANVLSSLRRALQREGYRILTASSAREALELLATEKVGVIVSDQRMPEMTGTELLGRVKLMYPRVVRIVLSGHTDLATITDAVNRGAVYKFLTKPWEHGVLRDTLREAFERHECADRDDAWP